MQATLVRAAVAAAFAAALLAGCDRDADRTASQKMDNAVERAQQRLAQVGEKAGQELSRAGEKTEEAVSQATGKLAQESRSPGVSDAAITASIKTDYLKDPDLSVLKIDVDTKDGVVTLNGLANDEPARERAAKLAEGIKGVREVRNFLVVKRA